MEELEILELLGNKIVFTVRIVHWFKYSVQFNQVHYNTHAVQNIKNYCSIIVQFLYSTLQSNTAKYIFCRIRLAYRRLYFLVLMTLYCWPHLVHLGLYSTYWPDRSRTTWTRWTCCVVRDQLVISLGCPPVWWILCSCREYDF